jgi:hypothetical protein
MKSVIFLDGIEQMAAYFAFEQTAPSGTLERFVFKLVDDKKIEEARSILGHGGRKIHVQGTVIPQKAPYNPQWSFHLQPETIGFFELQTEVCDANVTYVEDHLDSIGGAFLPKSFWCPWSSKLTAEVTASINPETEQSTKP